MQIYESLKHPTWECKYHVVFLPKYRRKTLFVRLRREVGPVFRSLAEQKECTVEEGHLAVGLVVSRRTERPLSDVRCGGRRANGS